MSAGELVVHIDELETFPISDQDGLTWRPIRRHFDIQAFGVNAYTATEAGQRVVEEHREADGGHEELYVVVSGRATFMVEGEDHDAPAGTLVHCPPGTLRGAIAAEPGTTVVGIGAQPGKVFEPSGWEWAFAAISHLDQGDTESARRVMAEGIDRYPDAWQGYYNFACIEARAGDKEAALRYLEQAAEREPERIAKFAADDEDFASIRDDERFLAITGKAHAGSTGS